MNYFILCLWIKVQDHIKEVIIKIVNINQIIIIVDNLYLLKVSINKIKVYLEVKMIFKILIFKLVQMN